MIGIHQVQNRKRRVERRPSLASSIVLRTGTFQHSQSINGTDFPIYITRCVPQFATNVAARNSATDWRARRSPQTLPLLNIQTGQLFTLTRTVISCHRSQTSLSRLILLGLSVTTLLPPYLPARVLHSRRDAEAASSTDRAWSHDEHYANCTPHSRAASGLTGASVFNSFTRS